MGSTPPDLAAIERAMVRIRRHMTRRSLAGLITRAVGPELMSVLGVLDVLDAGASTVGEVGKAMGLDPSRASRLVAAALKVGAVRRVASQEDARRVLLVIAPKGNELLEKAQQARLLFYARILRDWPATDVRRFGQLLTRFVDSLGGRGAPEAAPPKAPARRRRRPPAS